jgi:hypothetical protein
MIELSKEQKIELLKQAEETLNFQAIKNYPSLLCSYQAFALRKGLMEQVKQIAEMAREKIKANQNATYEQAVAIFS